MLIFFVLMYKTFTNCFKSVIIIKNIVSYKCQIFVDIRVTKCLSTFSFKTFDICVLL